MKEIVAYSCESSFSADEAKKLLYWFREFENSDDCPVSFAVMVKQIMRPNGLGRFFFTIAFMDYSDEFWPSLVDFINGPED